MSLGYFPERIQSGDIFYSASAGYCDEEGKCYLDLDEWHVRSIRARRGSKSHRAKALGLDVKKQVNLTRKGKYTWVKKSSKNGDYGWSSSISSMDRESFYLGDNLPIGYFSTPLKALKNERKNIEKKLNRGWISEEQAKRLKGMITRKIKSMGYKA
jgi:hypothetical protein